VHCAAAVLESGAHVRFYRASAGTFAPIAAPSGDALEPG